MVRARLRLGSVWTRLVSACLGSLWLRLGAALPASARLHLARPCPSWLCSGWLDSPRFGFGLGRPGEARGSQRRPGGARILILCSKSIHPRLYGGEKDSLWVGLGSGFAGLGPGSEQLASARHGQGSAQLCPSRPGSLWLCLAWLGCGRAGSARLGLGSGAALPGFGLRFWDSFFLSGINQNRPGKL